MKFNGYEIHITSQELPHLETAWTTIEVPNDKGEVISYRFKRDINKSQVFSISGYISMSTWAATMSEARGLNNSLLYTPSGVLTDGFGVQYTCLVESWSIQFVPAANKCTLDMTLRIP